MISNHIGIEVVKEGCSEIKIKPDLGNLKWCKGSFFTPYGVVEVFYKKEGGRVVTDIKAPTEIKIIR